MPPIPKKHKPPQDPGDGWVPKLLSVMLDTNKTKMIKARRKGCLAVHPRINLSDKDERKWTLTAVNSQLEIVVVRTEEDAYRVGNDLLRHHAGAMEEATGPKIIAKLGVDVLAWLIKCKRQGRYLPLQKELYDAETPPT